MLDRNFYPHTPTKTPGGFRSELPSCSTASEETDWFSFRGQIAVRNAHPLKSMT